MTPDNAITLHLTASSVDTFCRDLSRRLPDLGRRIAAIDALVTFISSQTAPGEQLKPEFPAIRQALLRSLEQARQELLGERAQELERALRNRSARHVALVYASLSRDAFWAVLRRLEPQFTADAWHEVRQWASSWFDHAQRKARQASPYPDAIDLNAAGIDAPEYLAMSDLCRYLGAH